MLDNNQNKQLFAEDAEEGKGIPEAVYLIAGTALCVVVYSILGVVVAPNIMMAQQQIVEENIENIKKDDKEWREKMRNQSQETKIELYNISAKRQEELTNKTARYMIEQKNFREEFQKYQTEASKLEKSDARTADQKQTTTIIHDQCERAVLDAQKAAEKRVAEERAKVDARRTHLLNN